MYKTIQDIYQSSLFNLPELVHGFSTRRFGDMRNKKKRNAFLSALGISEESLVWQEQVHRDAIHFVVLMEWSTVIPAQETESRE
ncbi:MAG: hypothetical protein UW22_C0006G0021 [Candidatus Gottesmanbacteria bacterium GW2011_GWB1_44_11c]|uniref:Uncharacterized protein n=1 Tax=Candidatus Gottesmanbacteria bacterium GW2011_GWB1_44_11c TaxID=1618447 RepID=A0A0G1GVU3_9BACT|nr:MAG: hypothetical protein UW22_C0006G0021 [Candidatus Gottesmanbacteria bacterium GW2011_GWB1_44_11c]